MTCAHLDKAYNNIRQELCNIGLLADGVYLDEIELYRISKWISWDTIWERTDGYVYDRGIDLIRQISGFKEGAIYIPSNVPAKGLHYLEDVIRHEYAHAWRWLDPEFIAQPWFADAFGRAYDSEDWPIGPKFYALLNIEEHTQEFNRLGLDADYVSAYALSSPREDFAETFSHYLIAPENISSYSKRKGVYRKLKAIDKAVKRKAKLLGTL